jgi:hypothetical protein
VGYFHYGTHVRMGPKQKLMEYTTVIENIRNCGQSEIVPTNEHQARPFSNIKDLAYLSRDKPRTGQNEKSPATPCPGRM